MKVLQINAVYGHGSTGTIVRDIEHLCLISGIECYVASPDPKVREARHGYVIGNTLDHKLHAVLSRLHGKQAYFSHIPTYNLIKWIEQIKPDIVHLHNLHSNYIHLNMLLDCLAKKDIKTIITLHDCWFYTGGCFHYTADGCKGWLNSCGVCPKGKADPIGLLGKQTSQILADRKKYLLAIPHLHITGVSQWMAHEPLRSFLKDIPNHIIYNGIDLNVFTPSLSDFRKRLNLEKKFVILGPASKWLLPINRKVLEDFIQLMQPDEVLLLFGVSERQKDYINSLQLGDRVITFGYTKDRNELAKLYSMADVFVNTTREDSLSLINVEAQACGTPVVTFDQTAPQETVDGKCGFAVAVGSAGEMYRHIQKIKRIEKVELSNKCIEWVSGMYNVDINYKKYINLYKYVSEV